MSAPWAVHSIGVRPFSFALEKSHPKFDKFFRTRVGHYLCVKFGIFCFHMGQFFLKFYVFIEEKFRLSLDEKETFSKDLR